MGLKDHLEDGIGHILDLGLDLDYLHVESADRLPGASTPRTGAMDKGVPDGGGGSDGAQSSNTSLGDSDESSDSEGETEQGHGGAGGEPGGVAGHAGRERLCHSPLLCPISGRPPDVPQDPPKRLKEYQTKMEFALKLGYAEGLVRLVLKKLGPEALINDVLGELVKLGKCDGEHASSSSSSSSSSQALSSPSPCPLPSASTACSSFPTHSPPQVEPLDDKDNLRPIVVDGSNVAMSHGNKEVFSCHGIQLAVDWFLGHGHKDITVFVPAWRKEQSRPDAPITDQEILRRLEKEKILVFTPSRRVQGRRVVCYDDRFIVKLAYESDGIIVSNDNYRDLGNEKPEWKKFIDERLLMYSFVNDKFMPPDDPLGRHGPSLENFLRKRPVVPEHRKQPCPYGKKCTYGHKCKFYHPERGNQPQRSVADELRASARTSAAKSLGDAGLIKSQSMPSSFQSDGGPDVKPTVPRRQSDPSAHARCYSDLEDRLGIKTKVEAGWNHSSSLPAPGGLPSYPQDPRGPPACMVTARRTPPFVYPDPYPRCDSPELSYYSMVNACSSLSLSAPRSPDRRRFPLDSELRLGSVASDCSSEGSISCSSSSDSYGARVSSPDPLLDDGPQCGHHHHHHRYPPHPASQPYVHGYRQGMARVQGVGQEEPPNPHLKHTLPYPPPHFRHPAVGTRSGCPGDYSPIPQNRPVPQSPPLDHALAPTHIEGISDSRYEQSLLQTRRPYQGHEHFSGWDSYHQHSHPRQLPTQPYYDQHAFWSMHESRKEAWPTPWGRPSATTHPAAAESHGGGRYQDVREKVFINLSNIFPPELVRLVMGRNPHVTDPQQLAVNILAEKSQLGY